MKKLGVVSAVALAALGGFAAESAADMPVVVTAQNVGWTCRKTAEGCIVDFTNKIGILKRKGRPDVTDPRMVSHASVFYRPTGKTYNFAIAPTNTLSVAFGAPMPDFPARFADTNLYASVDIPAPFDVGVTADRPSQRVVSNRCHEKFLIKTVPSAFYTRGWVLCAAADDPKKERTFTVRITRFMDDFEWDYTGRAPHAMVKIPVDLDTAKKEQVGEVTLAGKKVPLWLVEFPIDLGEIQDIVNTADHGNFLSTIGRYLDFEVCGPLLTRVGGLCDRTMNTDPKRTSAVTFYGARLAKGGASLAPHWMTPGNIFDGDDALETAVDLRVERPGTYRLSWEITDGEDGRVVRRGSRPFSTSESFVLDLRAFKTGWYGLDWKLEDAAKETILTHKASFAVLGKDTRQSEMGEGPYSTWSVSAHYRIPGDKQIYSAQLLHKAGFRMISTGLGGQFTDRAFRERWKIDTPVFEGHLDGKMAAVIAGRTTEEKLVAEYAKFRAEHPKARFAQIFWESAPDAYRQAPEITGGTFDAALGPMAGASNRLEHCRRAAAFMRKHFPDVYVSVGQSICCTEIIAEMIRGGIPEEQITHMGIEAVGRGNLPERPNSAGIQTADILREMAQRMGRPSWRPASGIETNYRRDTFLGTERQAQYYVRDLLLALCWRFPLVNIGEICDAGNHYCETPWGNDGLCRRYPMLYPKPSYVAVAAATKVMDRVVEARTLPTGDDCVYALACSRRDGKVAYAFWTSYGTAELELDVNAAPKAYSFFGRESAPKAKGGKLRIAASGRPNYLVAEPGTVTGVRCLRTDQTDAKKPTDYKTLVKLDDAAKWTLVTGKVEGVYGDLGKPFPTCRQPAKKPTFAVVKDAKLGACIELDLGEPDLSLPRAVSEYAVLELKEPVTIPGEPQSLGAVVKGNSGWGRLYWILEGADGKRAISSGHRDWKEDFDDGGKMTLGFSGWRFLSYPVGEKTSIVDYTINMASDLWFDGIDDVGAVKYPAKLVGVAFAAESRPLFLMERRAKEQKIRLSEIGFFD